MYRTKRKKVKVKLRFYIFCFVIIIALAGGLFFLIGYLRSTIPNKQYNSSKTEISTPTPFSTSLSTPAPTPETGKQVKILVENLPQNFGLNYELMKDNKVIEGFMSTVDLSFNSPEKYSLLPGISSFRGNNYRDSAIYGYADVKEEKLEKVWFSTTKYIDAWTGIGWTGQPSIVKWEDSIKNLMNIHADKKKKTNLKEVIYATLDGKIYFLDLEDGKQTRNPIDTGFPHKGSVTVDPRGYPLLYAGQGINSNGDIYGDIGHRIFSLIDQKLLYFINGIDPFAYRKWGAFDSTPLINGKTDTMFLVGENGLFYNIQLNTKFDTHRGTLSVTPEVLKMRYKNNRNTNYGSENSVAIYKNYAYFADNGGLLYCIDINNMKPIWMRSVTDDTDSTVVIEEAGPNEVYLYTGCGVDLQGVGGSAYIRKINAFTGELLWEKSYPCVLNKNVSGGVLATPVVGKNDIKDLVIFNVSKTKDSKNYMGGKLIAFDKKSGKEIWTITLQNYTWSSPVVIYTKEGKAYLVISDSLGNMMLINPKTGTILNKINLEANVEGSPAVYEDMIVVGTRGQKIWGIKIK